MILGCWPAALLLLLLLVGPVVSSKSDSGSTSDEAASYPQDEGPFPKCDPAWADYEECAARATSGDALKSGTAVGALAMKERIELENERRKREQVNQERYAELAREQKAQEELARQNLAANNQQLAEETRRMEAERLELVKEKEEDLSRERDLISRRQSQIEYLNQMTADNQRQQALDAAVRQAKQSFAERDQKRKDELVQSLALKAKSSILTARLAEVEQRRRDDLEQQRAEVERETEKVNQQRLALEKEVASTQAKAAASQAEAEQFFSANLEKLRKDVGEKTDDLLCRELELQKKDLEKAEQKQQAEFEAMKEEWKVAKHTEIQEKYAKFFSNPVESEYREGYKTGYTEAQKASGAKPASPANSEAQADALASAFRSGWGSKMLGPGRLYPPIPNSPVGLPPFSYASNATPIGGVAAWQPFPVIY